MGYKINRSSRRVLGLLVSFPDSELQQDQVNANVWLVFGGTGWEVELAVKSCSLVPPMPFQLLCTILKWFVASLEYVQ